MMEWKIREEIQTRIDKFLQENTEFSRNQIQHLIKSGDVLVNDSLVKPSYLLKNGDFITLNTPKIEKEVELKPVDLNLEIVYEDEYLAIINKPKGLVVHPSNTNEGVTLVSGLIHEFDLLSNEDEPLRRGIVHRLDKDTSGLLIIGKNDEAHNKLKLMFQRRQVKKHYLAIVYHEFKEYTGIIDKPIIRHKKHRQMMTTANTGRSAMTTYEVLSQNNGFAYLKLDLITGRTHQIRVHLKSINHPILGDPVYGPKKVYGNTGPYLHAYALEFNHPITKEKLNFSVEPPKEFQIELTKRGLKV
jgi:23S rRNA pseudouridine1911/1915/1917 synthase